MDRNINCDSNFTQKKHVALRKESVDRNRDAGDCTTTQVALRKESVDRNPCIAWQFTERRPSLSARRAWIEIDIPPNLDADHAVALRKESVDRNLLCGQLNMRISLSLSARRAWIEIVMQEIAQQRKSLSARRAWIEIPALLGNSQNDGRRSPQGERG